MDARDIYMETCRTWCLSSRGKLGTTAFVPFTAYFFKKKSSPVANIFVIAIHLSMRGTASVPSKLVISKLPVA